MPEVPRFAWPLRLDPATGSFAVVEQDSDEDIAQCVEAITRTRPGDRADLPDLGILDPTFEEQPVDLDAIRETFDRHEPRAAVLATTNPDALDTALADIGLQWDSIAISRDDEEA